MHVNAVEPVAGRSPLRFWNFILEIVTFEFFLTRLKMANGGGVIVLRSVLTALFIYLTALGLRNLFDASRTWWFSEVQFRLQLIETLPWYGAIFAAIYAGLYARFASQWTYLANVYNQIKAAECRKECMDTPLAEWKAGFIEDAEELHLIGKGVFAAVVRSWGKNEEVKEQFVKNAPGGAVRFAKVLRRAEAVWQQHERQWDSAA